jgi:sarcosine oxidase subunit beta
MFDAVIVGAGLHGCATALALRERGASVTVIERDYPGRQASGVNAGGVRRLNRDLAEVPLAVRAHQLWLELPQRLDDDCGFISSAQLRIATDDKALEALDKRHRLMRAHGYQHEELIDAEHLRELIPCITARAVGALYCAGDGFASPFQTTHALFRKAQSSGAVFQLHSPVVAVEPMSAGWRVHTAGGAVDAARLVNCAGAWANELAGMVGDSTPVSAIAPMLMITQRVPHFLRYVIGIEGHKLSFKQRLNGSLLIGGDHRGVVAEHGRSSRVDIDGLRANATAVLHAFPHLHDILVNRAWAGVEAMTPDRLPVIGFSRHHDNVLHAFGFSAHGFLLGPVVGEILADLITTGTSSLPIEPFCIARFADRQKSGSGHAPGAQ